ncbi:hypothetical protein RRG08_040149 [Elysia crispata]|uniref:Uncharacterized protein n=1 Tax=Elysia crispata TaxID=231223 RepID=A0AAE0XVZ1_9GAST|nr:hypothetical protein RRG08_040149 [Elysia crispata]
MHSFNETAVSGRGSHVTCQPCHQSCPTRLQQSGLSTVSELRGGITCDKIVVKGSKLVEMRSHTFSQRSFRWNQSQISSFISESGHPKLSNETLKQCLGVLRVTDQNQSKVATIGVFPIKLAGAQTRSTPHPLSDFIDVGSTL